MISEDNLKLARLIPPSTSGDTAVTLESSAEALSIAKAVQKDVESERALKKVDPVKHWNFYHGYHTKYFNKRKGEDDTDWADRKKRGLFANYIRFVVDLDTRFLYGRPKKIGRRYGMNDTTEKKLRDINKLININNLQMESKRSASLYGEQGLRLIAVDKRTGSQVTSATKIDDNVYPHPVKLDAQNTFFLTNPYDKVVAVTMVTEFKDYTDGEKLVVVTELITDDSRWVWHDDALMSAEVNKYSIRDEFVLERNNYERIDNVQDMLDLQVAFDECLTDNAYFFARHGRPQLVTEIDLSAVINKQNFAWKIDPDDEGTKKILDRIGYLVWDGKMEAAAEHLTNLESKIYKVSSTAAISTGDLKGIGNLRSGAALVTAHSPSIQKAQEMQIIWAENEEMLAKALIAFDAKIHNTTVEARFPGFDFEMRFPTDSGVPGDEHMNAEIRQININSHLKTSADLVAEANPSFSNQEIKDYVEQLVVDSKTQADALRVFETVEAPAKGSPSGGSSASKSTEQKKPKSS